MTYKQRQAVSARMKEYWAKKRASQHRITQTDTGVLTSFENAAFAYATRNSASAQDRPVIEAEFALAKAKLERALRA